MRNESKPTHPVGVSVLITRGTEVLLGLRKGGGAAGYWSTPGGRIELSETHLKCACRETMEETGLLLDSARISPLGFKEHFRFDDHYFMVYVHATEFFGRVSNKEPDRCEEWRWFDLRHLENLYDGDFYDGDFRCTEPASILNRLACELLELDILDRILVFKEQVCSEKS